MMKLLVFIGILVAVESFPRPKPIGGLSIPTGRSGKNSVNPGVNVSNNGEVTVSKTETSYREKEENKSDHEEDKFDHNDGHGHSVSGSSEKDSSSSKSVKEKETKEQSLTVGPSGGIRTSENKETDREKNTKNVESGRESYKEQSDGGSDHSKTYESGSEYKNTNETHDRVIKKEHKDYSFNPLTSESSSTKDESVTEEHDKKESSQGSGFQKEQTYDRDGNTIRRSRGESKSNYKNENAESTRLQSDSSKTSKGNNKGRNRGGSNGGQSNGNSDVNAGSNANGGATNNGESNNNVNSGTGGSNSINGGAQGNGGSNGDSSGEDISGQNGAGVDNDNNGQNGGNSQNGLDFSNLGINSNNNKNDGQESGSNSGTNGNSETDVDANSKTDVDRGTGTSANGNNQGSYENDRRGGSYTSTGANGENNSGKNQGANSGGSGGSVVNEEVDAEANQGAGADSGANSEGSAGSTQGPNLDFTEGADVGASVTSGANAAAAIGAGVRSNIEAGGTTSVGHQSHKLRFRKHILNLLDLEEKHLGLAKYDNNIEDSSEEAHKAADFEKIRKDYLLSVAQNIHNSRIVTDKHGRPRVVSPHHHSDEAEYLFGSSWGKSPHHKYAHKYGQSPISSHYANVKYVEDRFGDLPSLFGSKKSKLPSIIANQDGKQNVKTGGSGKYGGLNENSLDVFNKGVMFAKANKKYDGNSAVDLQLSPEQWIERFKKEAEHKHHRYGRIRGDKNQGRINLDKIDPIVRDAIISRNLADIFKTAITQDQVKTAMTRIFDDKEGVSPKNTNGFDQKQQKVTSKNNAKDVTANTNVNTRNPNDLFRQFKPNFDIAETSYDEAKKLIKHVKTDDLEITRDIFGAQVTPDPVLVNNIDDTGYANYESYGRNNELKTGVIDAFDNFGMTTVQDPQLNIRYVIDNVNLENNETVSKTDNSFSDFEKDSNSMPKTNIVDAKLNNSEEYNNNLQPKQSENRTNDIIQSRDGKTEVNLETVTNVENFDIEYTTKKQYIKNTSETNDYRNEDDKLNKTDKNFSIDVNHNTNKPTTKHSYSGFIDDYEFITENTPVNEKEKQNINNENYNNEDQLNVQNKVLNKTNLNYMSKNNDNLEVTTEFDTVIQNPLSMPNQTENVSEKKKKAFYDNKTYYDLSNTETLKLSYDDEKSTEVNPETTRSQNKTQTDADVVMTVSTETYGLSNSTLNSVTIKPVDNFTEIKYVDINKRDSKEYENYNDAESVKNDNTYFNTRQPNNKKFSNNTVITNRYDTTSEGTLYGDGENSFEDYAFDTTVSTNMQGHDTNNTSSTIRTAQKTNDANETISSTTLASVKSDENTAAVSTHELSTERLFARSAVEIDGDDALSINSTQDIDINSYNLVPEPVDLFKTGNITEIRNVTDSDTESMSDNTTSLIDNFGTKFNGTTALYDVNMTANFDSTTVDEVADASMTTKSTTSKFETSTIKYQNKESINGNQNVFQSSIIDDEYLSNRNPRNNDVNNNTEKQEESKTTEVNLAEVAFYDNKTEELGQSNKQTVKRGLLLDEDGPKDEEKEARNYDHSYTSGSNASLTTVFDTENQSAASRMGDGYKTGKPLNMDLFENSTKVTYQKPLGATQNNSFESTTVIDENPVNSITISTPENSSEILSGNQTIATPNSYLEPTTETNTDVTTEISRLPRSETLSATDENNTEMTFQRSTELITERNFHVATGMFIDETTKDSTKKSTGKSMDITLEKTSDIATNFEVEATSENSVRTTMNSNAEVQTQLSKQYLPKERETLVEKMKEVTLEKSMESTLKNTQSTNITTKSDKFTKTTSEMSKQAPHTTSETPTFLTSEKSVDNTTETHVEVTLEKSIESTAERSIEMATSEKSTQATVGKSSEITTEISRQARSKNSMDEHIKDISETSQTSLPENATVIKTEKSLQNVAEKKTGMTTEKSTQVTTERDTKMTSEITRKARSEQEILAHEEEDKEALLAKQDNTQFTTSENPKVTSEQTIEAKTEKTTEATENILRTAKLEENIENLDDTAEISRRARSEDQIPETQAPTTKTNKPTSKVKSETSSTKKPTTSRVLSTEKSTTTVKYTTVKSTEKPTTTKKPETLTTKKKSRSSKSKKSSSKYSQFLEALKSDRAKEEAQSEFDESISKSDDSTSSGEGYIHTTNLESLDYSNEEK